MEIKLREDCSTKNPDIAPALAARGDYMEDSLVDAGIDEVLEGVKTEDDEYSRGTALETIHERLIRRGHYGPYEHPQAFFVAEDVSRVCMAQVRTHRHMSFDVQSMRYCDFEHSEPKVPDTIDTEGRKPAFEKAAENSLKIYQDLVDDGVPKEDARFVLPLGTTVNMSFSANARSLMHLIDMRAAGDAQWEAREFAEQVLAEAKEWAPLAFNIYEEHAKGASKKAP